jgi:Xaa-Pro aminopeptidase
MSLTTSADRRELSVSVQELERRWALVRAAMAERGIDVLLMKGDADFLGGYLRYFTDIAAVAGMPITAVFPRDDLMTVVRHGPPADTLLPRSGGPLPGVKRILSHPGYTTLGYSVAVEIGLIGEALRPFANATIGLLGVHQLSWATVDHIRREYPQARLVDAADLVDAIRMIKSPEEQALIRRTAALQDKAIQTTFESIRPGMRERDISSVAQHASFLLGSEQGLYMCGSASAGQPTIPMTTRNQTRVIEKGDLVSLLIENSGPGGYYTHIMRICSVGKPPAQQIVEELELCLEAQRRTVAELRPGADPVEIFQSHNTFLREHNHPEESRNYCHSQGYDTLERPVFQPGETLRVQASMNIGCHPSWVSNGVQMWTCDNFLVGEHGAQQLHTFPHSIYQA